MARLFRLGFSSRAPVAPLAERRQLEDGASNPVSLSLEMAPRDIEAVRRPPRIRAYPPWYWDREASRWDEVVATPTNPHQFYYREADYLIAEILETRMRALELACGTGGSTAMQCRHVSDLVATDFSVKMVQQAAHRQNCNLVQFLVADASGLPFRGGTFHAVFSRGVVLSYVPDPMRMLREAHRVLRRGGSLALDAMNRIQGSSQKRTRLFCMMGGRPAYVEYAVQSGLQVRWIHWLDRRSPFVEIARKEERPDSRPRNLRKHVTSVERFEARLFRPQQLIRLVEQAGFREVNVVPLGHLAYTLGFADKGLRKFARNHRRELSRLYLRLRGHFRLDTALHLFVSAKRR